MKRKLIPRVTLSAAERRLTELQEQLRDGCDPSQLPIIALEKAAVNPNGGEAPTTADLVRWRDGVMAHMEAHGAQMSDGPRLGEALVTVIDPSPGDAAHPETWSYLGLWLFPDILASRWGLKDGRLPRDRWIGSQGGGRDRNHLKTWWRRWCLFGDLLLDGGKPLGEDELVNLTERTALARNGHLVRAAAGAIQRHPGDDRMLFTRELLKALTYKTGPVMLDVLDPGEIEELVARTAEEVLARRLPRRRQT